MPTRQIQSLPDAVALLNELGAPTRLVMHARLVSEVAEELLRVLSRMKVKVDSGWVRAGAALHDAGKIVHPAELSGPGSSHELEGERLLLAAGVPAHIARCCLSHARWSTMETSLEELVVALADKLWKGVRHSDLEKHVIEGVAGVLQKGFWDVFLDLDSAFEEIAAKGDERLERSRG